MKINDLIPTIDCDNKKDVILLVEDEPAIREITKMILEKVGYYVLESFDGYDALTIFMKYMNKINCIVCDLRMEFMQGEEFIENVYQHKSTIPVVLTSGRTDTIAEYRSQCKNPLKFFLEKPYGMSKLKEVVNKAIEKKNDKI